MAYRINRSETAEAAIQRLLLDQNRRALKLLASWRKDPPRHIHRSRQCFKRTRAVLRLLRPVAPYIFTVENRLYRDCARQLSYVRDAEAMVEAIGFLETSCNDDASGDSLAILKEGLRRRATAELDDSLVDLSGRCADVVAELGLANRRFHRLPLRGLRRKHLKRAAQKGLQRCASTFRKARDSDRAEDFHGWRKQVKYSFHHAHLMQDILPRWSHQYERPLEQLGQLLGNSQDLFVLDQLLSMQPDALHIDIHTQRIRRMIALSQYELRGKIVALGDRVFRFPGTHSRDNVVPLRSGLAVR